MEESTLDRFFVSASTPPPTAKISFVASARRSSSRTRNNSVGHATLRIILLFSTNSVLSGVTFSRFARSIQGPNKNRSGGITMKKSLFFASLLVFLIPSISRAQSSLDGNWKLDVNKTKMPEKPDVYNLQDGMYHCSTCVPPIDVKADGQDQKVSGDPYYDTVAVRVVDDHTVEFTNKKDGKTVATYKTVVSPDGKTATFEFSDSSASTEPVTGKGKATRVTNGPSGAHLISGSWRETKTENLSDNAAKVTFKVDGDTLSMTSPTGQSYSAKLDGSDAPYKGDPGTSSVSVKRINKNVFEETDKRNDKVITIVRMTVSPGGKTLTMDISDKERGTTAQLIFDKQ
jgi:hypothetical protein